MKIPFVEEIPTFTARTKLGMRRNMTMEQREILDAIDIIEQKADRALKLGVLAFNIGLLLFIVLILTQGPAMLKVFTHWFAGMNVDTVVAFIGLSSP